MSRWINNHTVVKDDAEKPCLKLRYCPYGQLVEEFPLAEGHKSCHIFGHDCPVFYHYQTIPNEENVDG